MTDPRRMVFWAAAYVAVGVMSFGIIAAVDRDKIHVVKVKQVPTFVPKPVEVKR